MDENTVNKNTESAETTPNAAETTPSTESEEIKRLKAELARQKAATDKASKEAADFKKQARALQSEDERRKAEQDEVNATRDARLAELEKQAATSTISKRLLSFVGDESVADQVAGFLYGAEDTDGAIDAISKAWAAKEKALRLEYSKIPAPAAGDGAPTTTKEQIQSMTYMQRLEFARKFPETYKKLIE